MNSQLSRCPGSFQRTLGRILFSALFVSLAGSFAFSPHQAAARPNGPAAAHRQIALAVAMLMEREHLSGHALDDTISERCMKAYLKGLDPLKLYFYQSDIDEFMKSKTQLDDMFRRGDIRFAHNVFTRFLARVDERINTAQTELGKEHDFTLDEEMIRKSEAAKYPRSPEEAADLWRKRVKYDLLKETTDDVPYEEAVEKLRKRYSSIQKRWHQTNSNELLEIYLTAMTSGFDPHSSYMSADTLQNFNIMMRLELDGIGASLRNVDGYTVVHKVIPGGAADKEGQLKAEDKIVSVGQGTDGEMHDIVDMKLNDVVKQIRGKRGTVVRLEVVSAEGAGREIYTITRARIELKDSEARSVILEHGKKPDGTPFQIGVIQLPSFYMDMDGARLGLPNFKSTTRDVRRLLQDFKSKQVDLVLVDLRWNGGGSLTEAVNMTGLFIDRGPVVQVKGPDGRTQPYNDPEAGMEWSGPLVVMMNKFSASASEIYAGAIQDYGRGIVIGDHATHGKGTVQQLFDLGNALFRTPNRPNLGALKLTIQQFYRPSGDSTQNRGVEADIELPFRTTHLPVGESDLDYALAFNQVQPLKHEQYYMLDSPVLDQLRAQSAARVKQSEFFARELRRIDRYEAQKDRETVTLNKEKFLAERDEINADKEEEDSYEKLSDPDRPVFEMDDYGKEALDITVDYLRMLGAKKMAVAGKQRRFTGIVPD